jgi:Cu2+-containing amine oxidase
VAVEKLPDKLVLTTQATAGWYRYIQNIEFHANGTIRPAFGFTAVDYPCVSRPHTHHGYWRFDFDVDGWAADQVEERKLFFFLPWWTKLSTEVARLRASSGVRRWRVRDQRTGRGVEIWPDPHDGVGGDPFGGADVWALRYHPNETDDGGSTGGPGGDAQHIDPYLTGESLDGQDVVLWYRIGHRHARGLDCEYQGPLIRLTGSW